MQKDLVLFGASRLGEIALKKIISNNVYHVVYFSDNDQKKWGERIGGIEVIPPSMILPLASNSDVVIASQYDLAIAKQLFEANIKKFGVIDETSWEIDFFDYRHVKSLDKKNNKISLIMNNNSGSNTLALYKNVTDKIAKAYSVELIDSKNKKGNYYLDLLESKLVMHTHDGSFDNTQINVQLWHGFPLKTLSNMANFPENIKTRNSLRWSKLDAVISYSQTYSTFMNACFGINGNKYIITGMPRNDLLFGTEGKKKLSKLIKCNLDKKKVILYMPTFRETIHELTDGDENKFNILQASGFDMEKYDDFLKDQDIIMVLKFHPVHIKQATNYIKEMNLKNIYILDDISLNQSSLDLYEIINAADLLITDYSSIYFDFLLLDKPIIFVPLDLQEYKNSRGFLIENYDFWTPGPKCFILDQLMDEIKKSLNYHSYYQRERKTICNIVHHYKDANSSLRVWELIDSLMKKSING
ncbi:MAG TPA: hypothetical protein GXZ24_05665 [Firmicutes bacterium]|jgi:CDP-glycerol glycerophosphotransferase (TagB/SpsB family)|nr:hypothetical protein [Bacillota bacterium]